MASCNFRPNFWRPTTCSNCLRPKSCHHQSDGYEKRRESRKQGKTAAKPTIETRDPKRLVGVVSPYAVVEVNAKPAAVCVATEHSAGARAECLRRKKGQSGDGVSCKKYALPRRKAPPPPLQMHLHANSSQNKCRTDAVAEKSSAIRLKKKAGPKKPPRTISTYLEDMTVLNPDKKDLDYSVLSDCSSEARGGHVSGHLASLMADTLQRVYAKFLEKVMRQDPLWEISWQNLSLLSSHTVVYKGVQMSLQKLHQQLDRESENDIRISRMLLPHPNLCLVRALLPPPSFPQLSSSSHYLLRDCCGMGTLAELLPARRASLTPQQLQQLLLICIVQVFSAVNFIYNKGVCHRAIALDCLYATKYGDHWIVKMGHFQYALHRPGPVNATSFVYRFEELHWLGGADCRLPPEIMNVSDDAQTLNYSGTDCFAIGCLIYEFLGLDNPFEVNSQLVYTQYTAADLPALPFSSLATQKLVWLLLCKDCQDRLTPYTALLVCQALLWLPSHCLDSQVTEMILEQQLDYERGSLVASLATMDIRPIPLPHVLHANFLHSCNVTNLMHTLCLLYSYV